MDLVICGISIGSNANIIGEYWIYRFYIHRNNKTDPTIDIYKMLMTNAKLNFDQPFITAVMVF